MQQIGLTQVRVSGDVAIPSNTVPLEETNRRGVRLRGCAAFRMRGVMLGSCTMHHAASSVAVRKAGASLVQSMKSAENNKHSIPYSLAACRHGCRKSDT